MKVYKELEEIARMNAKIADAVNRLEKDGDWDGLDIQCAMLIDNCVERNGHLYRGDRQLDNYGLVDDEYYCEQYSGYCEDDFHGSLYFATDTKGLFIEVPFWN
ncbi:MAG: hypothetical protein MJ230_07225 [bacterium]|nr:hypothetical protein [bacterium]